MVRLGPDYVLAYGYVTDRRVASVYVTARGMGAEQARMVGNVWYVLYAGPGVNPVLDGVAGYDLAGQRVAEATV